MFRFWADNISAFLVLQLQDGRTALMVAVDGGWVAVVQEILASGNVDREVLDRWGMTAVDIGCVRKNKEVVELLGGEFKCKEVPVRRFNSEKLPRSPRMKQLASRPQSVSCPESENLHYRTSILQQVTKIIKKAV